MSKKALAEEEISEIRNRRLVIKDTVLVYAISYLLVTAPFGVVSYAQSVPYLLGSVIPAVAAFVISKAARMSAVGNELPKEGTKKVA